MGGTGYYHSFGLFLETCKENETFKKYNNGGWYCWLYAYISICV